MSTRLSSAFEEGYQKIRNHQAMSPDATGKTMICDLEVMHSHRNLVKCFGINIGY